MSENKKDIKITDDEKFNQLNREYTICLNKYYDMFFDDKEVDFNNICLDLKNKLISMNNIYNGFNNEFKLFIENNK